MSHWVVVGRLSFRNASSEHVRRLDWCRRGVRDASGAMRCGARKGLSIKRRWQSGFGGAELDDEGALDWMPKRSRSS